jgi:hypothetical protein
MNGTATKSVLPAGRRRDDEAGERGEDLSAPDPFLDFFAAIGTGRLPSPVGGWNGQFIGALRA